MLAAVAIAATAAVWCTALYTSAWRANHAPPGPEPRVISLTSVEKRHVMPDQIRWQVTVSARAADEQAALRQLARDADRARSYLLGLGVTPAELSTRPASCDEVLKPAPGPRSDEGLQVPDGFRAVRTFEVHSTDLRRSREILTTIAITPAMSFLAVDEPTCASSAIDAVERELLAAARATVRAKGAAAVAAIGGGRLGRLVTSDLGVFAMPDRGGSTQATCEAGSEATATVTASFELD